MSGFALDVPLHQQNHDADAIRVRVVCADGSGQDAIVPVERLPWQMASPRADAAVASEQPADGVADQPPAYHTEHRLHIAHDTANEIAPMADAAPLVDL